MYPLDSSGAAKTCYVKVVSDDWVIVEFVTDREEEAYWRTPVHIEGDGARQHKIEVAEVVAGQIDSVLVVVKGWDEKTVH
ncbi:hypothetical protein ES705_39242 [subsurface metagenome]